MHILWKNHPYDKTLNGTKEHVNSAFGAAAVGYKQAEEIPALPPRGSAGWLAARQEQDNSRTAPVIEWGILTTAKGAVNVVKKVGSDTFFCSTPPDDCPPSIRQQFLDAAAVNPEANQLAIEKAKQEQIARDAADKAAGRVSILSAMFGSKPL